MSNVTAQLILDLAQSRHPLFSNALAPFGALLKTMDSRQRSLLLRYGGAVDGLTNTTVQLATNFNGVLVGNTTGDNSGVPYTGSTDNGAGWPEHLEGETPYVDFEETPIVPTPTHADTVQDGWATHIDDDGVPYIDFEEAPIAGDPFGRNGGTPGFPLPTDFIKLVLVTAVMSDSTVVPVDVIPERDRLNAQRRSGLMVFVSGNRLVPLRPLAANNGGDPWSRPVSAVQLSYVALPVLANLYDRIALPAALHEALISAMAEFLAFGTPGLTAGTIDRFIMSARAAEEAIGQDSIDVIGATTPHSVRYRG